MRRIGILCAVVLAAGTVAAVGLAAADEPRPFDLQAHRGGLGLTVENTLPAFANALELGVSTLELDVQITADGFAVVTHDRDPSPDKCVDTVPAFLGDPKFPYVPPKTYIRDLTLAQVRTIDCGSRQLPGHPEQRTAPGARMPLLSEVFDLVRRYRADGVLLNIETKVEAPAPEQTAPREQFVRVVADEIHRAGIENQVTIQSFDWGSLIRMREVAPELPLVALTSGQENLRIGEPGPSPWLGGIDIDDYSGTPQERLVAAAKSIGAQAISPVHGDPQDGAVTDPGYRPFTTAALVRAAHRDGLRVVPWTVDDPPTMSALLDLGVDGLITNRPDVLRTVLSDRGYALPTAYPRP
ncbi:glycerophosphodiester phosphodiesterase family protein [Nocardia blacklockiae]|uniref:glycerophosphodiester phosphodiesterase family protein n=1 Tax=Nocardia blacklockiae TaxID=480036 RepID=UPI0018937089|nr:glycerophosphodiester phosphodiesterase family protein [Nocardia blacklockiae]MBF6172796.1 glycerophosphodiester phosphodiesterase [Nocardia blacklockiae]